MPIVGHNPHAIIVVQATQAALDHGHSLLRSLMDSSEKTLPNTNAKGCQVIRQETETAKSDYENILTELSQVTTAFFLSVSCCILVCVCRKLSGSSDKVRDLFEGKRQKGFFGKQNVVNLFLPLTALSFILFYEGSRVLVVLGLLKMDGLRL